MNKFKNFTISEDSNLLVASKAISVNKNRCVFLERNNKIIGVFSEGDLIRALLEGSDLNSIVKPYINYNFFYLTEKNLIEAKKIFLIHGITAIPILDKKNMSLVDIITTYDILKMN